MEKHFNRREYDREINTLDTRIQALNKLTKILGDKTFEEYCKSLNERTNFKNARLSADALGELETYLELERLDIAKGNIDKSLLVTDGKRGYRLSEDALSQIKDKYTTHFTPKEEQYLKTLEKVREILKDVPYQLTDALYYDKYSQNWVLDFRKYSSISQLVGSRV